MLKKRQCIRCLDNLCFSFWENRPRAKVLRIFDDRRKLTAILFEG